MKKIRMLVSTNIIGSRVEDVMEFEDNATEEDIQECFEDWIWNTIDANWWEEDE